MERAGKVGDQLLVIELVQRKAITGLAVVFKTFDIGNYPRIHFQLDVPCRIRLTGFVVLVLKLIRVTLPLGMT